MGRIEKLDNERWKGWDWAASNKLNEVIEAVNTLTERVDTLEKGTNHSNSVYGTFESRIFDLEEQIRELNPDLPTQVEPDKILGVKVETDPRLKKDEYYFKPSEPDTEQKWYPHVSRGQIDIVVMSSGTITLRVWAFSTREEAEAAAEKIRNLLKGQS